MNINATIRKLQKAILLKGLFIKVGTNQFYSEEQKRIITMYRLSTTVSYKCKDGNWKDKDYEILKSASTLEILTCMKEIWEQVGE